MKAFTFSQEDRPNIEQTKKMQRNGSEKLRVCVEQSGTPPATPLAIYAMRFCLHLRSTSHVINLASFKSACQQKPPQAKCYSNLLAFEVEARCSTEAARMWFMVCGLVFFSRSQDMVSRFPSQDISPPFKPQLSFRDNSGALR